MEKSKPSSGLGVDAATQQLLAAAAERYRSGRMAEAEALCQQVLAKVTNQPDALHLLGVTAAQSGRLGEARQLLERAVAVQANDAELLNSLANVHASQGQLSHAAQRYREVLAIAPRHAGAWYNLGNVLFRQAQFADAAKSYRKAIECRPDWSDAHCNLGQALDALGDSNAALTHYQSAVALRPDSVEGHFSFAVALERRSDYDNAKAHYELTLALKPDFTAALINLGMLLQDRGDQETAIELFQRALIVDPNLADVHANIGLALLNQDKLEQADASFVRALEIDRELIAARWLRPRLLPVLYDTEAEIDEYRSHYAEGLQKLEAMVDEIDADSVDTAIIGLALRTNFHLNYQGRDDIELQRQWGALVSRVVGAKYPNWTSTCPPSVRLNRPLRVGFACAYLWNHTVGKLFRGWIEGLDSSRFTVYCYHLGVHTDSVTEVLRERSHRFYQVEQDFFYRDQQTFASVCAHICDDVLDVLIYPEIGMDPGTALMAGLRLAPVQAMAWGHPVTSGLPTVDYFLSSDLMEPLNSESQYSEQLVRLPNLSICYARPDLGVAAKTRADFGFPHESTVYLSCQSLYKYLPQYDWILPAIAREVTAARFVFLAHLVPAITEKFRSRLRQAFDEVGLDMDAHCTFLPRLSQRDYYDLNLNADIYLDTMGWSGGNSTIEAVTAGLPVVTCPGSLMRARHSYAVLKCLSVEETIGGSPQNYIDIAVRLGQDTDWRREVTSKMQFGEARLFDDREAIAGVEVFLEDAVGGAH